MDINKEIFFTFLESTDWNKEKTFSLFQRLNKEKDELIEKLEEDVKKQKSNYNEIRKITDITLEKYDNCLKLCDSLRKENSSLKSKNTQNKFVQTYVQNVKHAVVKYDMKHTIIEPSFPKKLLTIENSISNLNLDKLWDDAKKIMNSENTFKDKNRELIILLVEYKKKLIKLMGHKWYNKCRNCVQDFSSDNEKEQLQLYKNIINLFSNIFQNEW